MKKTKFIRGDRVRVEIDGLGQPMEPMEGTVLNSAERFDLSRQGGMTNVMWDKTWCSSCIVAWTLTKDLRKIRRISLVQWLDNVQKNIKKEFDRG